MLMKIGAQPPLMTDAFPARSGPLGVVPRLADLDETIPLGQGSRPQDAAEVLPMRCLRCQGTVERGTAPVQVEGTGYRLAWENVPAWICTRCDLAYFEPHEVETVRRAVKALKALGPAEEVRQAG